tara:strand:- start:652 stop:1239 length:588 start_codon:yes stop_codon:yes gene_type:complete
MTTTLREDIIKEISENWKEQHFDEDQRDFFIDLLLELKPKYCLETGFCTGSSSATILSSCKPDKMITIGLDADSVYGLGNDKGVAGALEEKYNFKLVSGDSTQVLNDEFFEKEFGDGVDFFHVDGGHTYHVARSDMESAMSHMNEGSVMIVDDYHSLQCPLKTVDEAVDDFVKEYNLNFHSVNTESGKGMAIIRF